MEGSGLNADVVCECTQTYHCIKQILDVMNIVLLLHANFRCDEYIFSGTTFKLVATKLAIEQSRPVSHVAAECPQIFYSIN